MKKVLSKINIEGSLKGTWDLFLWKEGDIKFVELKRKGKDKIRRSQIEFFEKALEAEFEENNFEIYEWKESE